jgi:uncharacterized protein (TIGR03083 family)
VDPSAYLRHLRADSAALLLAARRAPDADISSCPGWTMTDLLGHTSTVHHWVAEILRTRATQRPDRVFSREVPSGFDAVAAWFDAGAADLVGVLEATGPDASVWNWYDDAVGPSRFWFRRMAQETVIHRYDAEETVIDAALAADGIDEYLSFVARDLPESPIPALAGSLSLLATDIELSWHIQLAPDRLTLTAEAAGGTTISASASDLYLWLLHRRAATNVTGDGVAVRAWNAVTFD